MQRNVAQAGQKIKIWSLGLRLFHWGLALAVGFNFYTGKFGDGIDSMVWHERFGVGVLTLLVFRFLWGLWGDDTARFVNLIPSPARLWHYLSREMFQPKPSNAIGHSPSAAMGALTLLGCLLVQTASGLFSTDDIITEGPLCAAVSAKVCSIATQVHFYNSYALIACIAAHMGALLFYTFYKRESLVPAMFTGKKPIEAGKDNDVNKPRMSNISLGAVTFGLAALITWFGVYGWRRL